MNTLLNKNRGFTLVEVLLSITILSIVILVVGSVLANNATYTKMADNKLPAIQIANSILQVYQQKSFTDLEPEIGKKEQVNIQDVLGLDSSSEVSQYKAYVEISKNEDSRLTNRLLLVKVSVETNGDSGNATELEGYVKQ
ncbi:type IV pilus modification PilV family protein [Heyndrickxia ginsengihumi]|uniref:Pilin n=1 Tax=Heyndrickxia ginsengihumi TaxID=363870 RepID=A0A0A6VF73_9BACI|nr:type II secretion system protein [Heyndrickxia ginsengihumi]KHD86890.1 pilin [Heyndrickxia ginsengihumi]MBE6183847.1 type II secretion system protein [Bacillus sp. (in: firmicutes)]MCM3021901.1 type II secretion system GspH family protein [Heyndrickxia ginsengihumi]NEY20413.1 type II secretion system protein [Heyndrickxia ginsengihumi]